MKTLLTKLKACKPALDWVGDKTIEQAWNECQRGDWLLWLAAKLDIDRKILVYAASQCARTSLQYVPIDEKRPLIAIETAERWTRGEATLDEVKIAADAAYASDASDLLLMLLLMLLLLLMMPLLVLML